MYEKSVHVVTEQGKSYFVDATTMNAQIKAPAMRGADRKTMTCVFPREIAEVLGMREKQIVHYDLVRVDIYVEELRFAGAGVGGNANDAVSGARRAPPPAPAPPKGSVADEHEEDARIVKAHGMLRVCKKGREETKWRVVLNGWERDLGEWVHVLTREGDQYYYHKERRNAQWAPPIDYEDPLS